MNREIKRKPDIPNLTLQSIKLLSELCFKEDTLEKVDLIFAFGTNIAPQILARKIEFLLENKYSESVIITGGIASYNDNHKSSVAESEIIYNYIEKTKIPTNSKFILEKKSKNTIENVLLAKELVDFNKIKSGICLSHSYASRRSVQTLRNIYSRKIISFPFNIPIDKQNSSYIQCNNWHKTQLGKSLVWGEFLRLKTYGRRKDFPLTKEMEEIIHKIEKILIPPN